MKNLYGRNGARHWLSLREGLIVASAIAAAATAQPAHAETLTMICGGYSVAFSPGNLTSHAPKKDRDYPITKVDRQNGRTVVSGKTQYGKITAFFSKDGHSSIVWTNGKDVVLNQCTSETVLATQAPLQERRSAKPDPEDGDMLRNRPPIPMPKAPKQEEKNTDQLLFSWSGAGDMTTRPFIVDGPWEIQWSGDNIYIRVLHADGTLVSSNLGKGSGSAYQPTGGSYYLQISAGDGNWTVKITAIAKQEVDMPPSEGRATKTPKHTETSKLAPGEMPPFEKTFIDIIDSAKEQYSQGTTDIQKGATRPSRAKQICAAFDGQAADWVGTITQLTTNGDGYGVLKIEVANGIDVSTSNNSFSAIGDHTLIAPDSPIYQTLLGLKPQTKVRFSGSFFKNSDSDCVREHSLTMNGSMTDPDFLFRFTAVDEQTDGGRL